jgi:hypothetical protein
VAAEKRIPAFTEEQVAELAAITADASGADGLPLGARDEAWDGPAATKDYELPADADCFMWKDSDGDPAVKSSYKFPFVSKDGGKHAVWKAVTAVAGVLSGARGGADIPDADKAKIKTAVEGYYKAAAKKYEDDTITVPWKDDNANAEADTEELAAVANTAVCADGDCGHPDGMHGGDGNMGACSALGCDCDGFETTDMDGEDLAAAAVDGLIAEIAEYVTVRDGQDTPLRDTLARFALTFAGDDGIPLIDAHKPSSRIPKRNPSPRLPDITKVPTGSDKASAQMQWTATLAPEAAMTADNRAFAPDSISWRDLPLTLMGLVETSAEGGHDGAQVAGRIDNIWREGNLIQASGVFDDGEFGQMIARMVGDGTLRGISVDLAVHQYDVGPKSDWFDAEGVWAPKPDDETDAPSLIDIAFGEKGDDTIIVVADATIGMATACPFQAFAEATIQLASSLVASTQLEAMWTVTSQGGYRVTPVRNAAALVASAVETEIPVRPPVEWFANPEFDGPQPLTVTDDGQVYGHAAEWNVPHIAFPDNHVYAPRSKTDYAYYMLGEIACADGERVPVGNITLGTGHASSGLGQAAAAAHYDHTGTVVADVACGEDEHGIWVAGAVRPGTSEETIRVLRAAKLSGDWRNVNGNLELVAALAVNVPGFPIPRTRASVVASGEAPEVMSLTAAGIVCGAECQAAMAEIAELADSIEA